MQHQKLIQRVTRIVITFITLFLFICSKPENSDDSHPFNSSNPELNEHNVQNRYAPKAEAGPDTTVGVNESIHLHGIGEDTADGSILKYEWKFGNSDWVETSSGDTTITAPPTAQSYVCSLRVTDNDGLTGVDNVLITVTSSDLAGPVITLVTPNKDYIKVRESSLNVTVACTDPSGIASIICILNDKFTAINQVAGNRYSVNVTNLAVGDNTLIFIATDGSSNANKSTKSITIIKMDDQNPDNPITPLSIVGYWTAEMDLSAASLGNYLINLSIMTTDSSFELSIVESGQANNKTLYQHSGTWRIDQNNSGGKDSLYLFGKECSVIDTTGGSVTMRQLPESVANQTVALDTTRTPADEWIINLGNIAPIIAGVLPPEFIPFLSYINMDLIFKRKERTYIR